MTTAPAGGTLSLLVLGFALGWSVAWPPGPVNAEIVRRGLARGFMPAFGLLMGACAGDALWALGVALGAGLIFASATAKLALAFLSTALLLALAFVFLRGAVQSFLLARRGGSAPAARRFESAHGSFLLGATMTLTSPWNIAFWLAVIGRPDVAGRGLAAAFLIAGAVILGAASWGLILTLSVVGLRARFASAAWDIMTKAATGLLMLYFAFSAAARLALPQRLLGLVP